MLIIVMGHEATSDASCMGVGLKSCWLIGTLITSGPLCEYATDGLEEGFTAYLSPVIPIRGNFQVYQVLTRWTSRWSGCCLSLFMNPALNDTGGTYLGKDQCCTPGLLQRFVQLKSKMSRCCRLPCMSDFSAGWSRHRWHHTSTRQPTPRRSHSLEQNNVLMQVILDL